MGRLWYGWCRCVMCVMICVWMKSMGASALLGVDGIMSVYHSSTNKCIKTMCVLLMLKGIIVVAIAPTIAALFHTGCEGLG